MCSSNKVKNTQARTHTVLSVCMHSFTRSTHFIYICFFAVGFHLTYLENSIFVLSHLTVFVNMFACILNCVRHGAGSCMYFFIASRHQFKVRMMETFRFVIDTLGQYLSFRLRLRVFCYVSLSHTFSVRLSEIWKFNIMYDTKHFNFQ